MTEDKFFRTYMKKKKQKKMTAEFMCSVMQEAFPLGKKVYISKYYYIFGYENYGVWALPLDKEKEPTRRNLIFITYPMLIRNVELQEDGLSEKEIIKYKLLQPDLCKNLVPTEGQLSFYEDYIGMSYRGLWLKEHHDDVILMLSFYLIVILLLVRLITMPTFLILLFIELVLGVILL